MSTKEPARRRTPESRWHPGCISWMPALAWAMIWMTLGCAMAGIEPRPSPPSTATVEMAQGPPLLVTRFKNEIQEDLKGHLAAELSETREALTQASTEPARFKHDRAVDTLKDPWRGLSVIERDGYRIAAVTLNDDVNLAILAGLLNGRRAQPLQRAPRLSFPAGTAPEEHLDFIQRILEAAELERVQALQEVSNDDQRFLLGHARELAEEFVPQADASEGASMDVAERDLRFIRLTAERLDLAGLVSTADLLAGLADERWLARLPRVLGAHRARVEPLPGISGEVLSVIETSMGLIVVGGVGPNRYELGEGIALVLDLGGDDTYLGTIAAPENGEAGNRVVIDIAGNDTYRPDPLGLATGRLGVGLLIERAGDDVYHLSTGAGGSGFAGVGVLIDASGDDRYIGAKLTQGAAVGGVGILLDVAGDDHFTSFGYALGFGGPNGVGVVVDIKGNDRYHCGGAYPSSYNQTDAPDSRPGDDDFQYVGFCLGVGSGKRVLASDGGERRDAFAGGYGILVDVGGDDRYRSANFSQGTGYFFGIGAKLDLSGMDEHHAARYGHGAAAHYGVGVFVESGGSDHYSSSGPVYNGATAWDASVAFAVDADDGDDIYELSRSDGLGRADHRSWSLFIDEGGRDRYTVPNGMGAATDGAVSGFFDLGGFDEYVHVSGLGSGLAGNARTQVRERGGLFVDR